MASGPLRQDGSYTRPVDLVHLSRHTMGDTALERDVLQMFVVQSQVHLIRLKDARDTVSWKAAAHTIKGAARGIGAWPVADAAEAAELVAGRDPEAMAQALRRLNELIHSTNQFIRDLLAETPA